MANHEKAPTIGRGLPTRSQSLAVLLQAKAEAGHVRAGGASLSGAAQADVALEVVAVEGDHFLVSSVADGGEAAAGGCCVGRVVSRLLDAEGQVSVSAGSGAGQDDLNVSLIAGQVDAGLIAGAGDGGRGQEGEVLELVERELM